MKKILNIHDEISETDEDFIKEEILIKQFEKEFWEAEDKIEFMKEIIRKCET